MLILSLALLLTFAWGLPELSINKQRKGAVSDALLRRRVVGADIVNEPDWSYYFVGYYVRVFVGTPPQQQTLAISTGSSDFFLDSSAASACQVSGDAVSPCYGGTFDNNTSTTYQQLAPSPAFNISYVDGSGFSGPFGIDTVLIGGVNYTGVQFGIAENATNDIPPLTGILGLDYYQYEESAAHYPTILQVMTAPGDEEIPSMLYSISLGNGGSLLFGAFDATRYTGPLKTLDPLPTVNSTAVKELMTTITSAKVTINGSTEQLWSGGSTDNNAYSRDDASIPVFLEYASLGMTFPQSVYESVIAPQFPYLTEYGNCSCSYADTDDFFTLTFAQEVEINFPIRNLLIPLWDTSTQEPIVYDNGTQMCSILIVGGPEKPNGGTAYVMGWGFLESMYTVFDLDNRQISIAQAAASVASEPHIIPIQAGPNRVAEAAASVASTTPHTTTTGTMTTTATSPPEPPHHHSNTAAIAGGVVGGVVGIALIAGAAYFIVRRGRSKRKSKMMQSPMLQADPSPRVR